MVIFIFKTQKNYDVAKGKTFLFALWKTSQKPIKQGLSIVDNIVEMWIYFIILYCLFYCIFDFFCVLYEKKRCFCVINPKENRKQLPSNYAHINFVNFYLFETKMHLHKSGFYIIVSDFLFVK